MNSRAALMERVRRDLADVGRRDLDTAAFESRVLGALRRAVPIDAAFFATSDPDTLLFTGGTQEDPLIPARSRLMRNELLEDDVNQFFRLAQTRPPVASLYGATGGRMESSPRYREILVPLGLGDEMRVALVDGGGCWGYMCLHRERVSRPFGADEATFLAGVAPLIAAGLRASLAPARPGAEVADGGRGMILLGPNLEVAAADDAAWAWLERTAVEEWRGDLELPVAVQAVAARLLARGEGGEESGPAPTARLRTRSGGWLGVRACRLSGPGMAEIVAVVLEPPAAPELLALIARLHALTAREAEVVRLVVRGRSTAEMSSALHISEHTVQDHLKSIFDKVGVRSRRDLVARLGGAV